MAGRAYGEQITEAIQAARVMVLIFSEHVNQSQAVHNEINLAAGHNVTIVPFRIAAVAFNPELHYYLGRTHWLDAFPKPPHSYIGALKETIRRNLGAATEPAAGPEAAPAPTVSPAPASARSRRLMLFGGAGAVGVLLLAVVAGIFLRAPGQQSDTLPYGADTTPIRAADPQQVAGYEDVVAPKGPPLTLQGATVITTAQLVAKIKAHDAGQIHLWLIDARGCSTEPTLPTADCMQPNTIQKVEFEIPSKTMELIFFCLDGSCPESYQLAKSAVAAGYTDVVWYRGGVNAWAAAGLPTVSHSP